MARLQQDGVLIKQANVLEALTHIDHLVFDKTGTLTQGKFSIVRTESITDITSDRLLSYVASIEAFSEHPIAQAFSQIETTHVSTPKQYLNLGVEGTIDGMLIRCGTRQFMRHQAAIAQYTVLADATIYVESDKQLLGGIWLNDSLKPDTQATLIRLAQYQQTILSGDAQINVETIAKQLPIQHIKAHCTPAQKLAYVRERQVLGEHVLMLGDGINDSPVLAQANVSISVGNASDLAKSASDVIFLQPSLAPLTQLLAIATACKRTIIQNFMWAIGYNLVVLPFAITGILTPWMAALGMSISSIIVVYNSSRLLSFQQLDLPK